MATTLTLFCVISGELASNAFKVKTENNADVADLKDAVFDKIDKTGILAKDLTLWRVSIPPSDDDELPIVLDTLNSDKKGLTSRMRLSTLFPKGPDDNTYIIVERPKCEQVDPEVATLRKELSDLRSISATFAITVKPDKKVACTWTTTIDTATVDKMKEFLFEEFPQYAHDNFAEVFVYTGLSKPDRVHDDQHLRDILRVCKLNFRCRMTISLESPSKGFSAWNFNDVCIEYNLSKAENPPISVLPSFTDIQPAPWNPDLHTVALDSLYNEVHTRVCSMDLLGSNEPTRSFVVSSFLLATTTLFKEDLYLASQRDLSGRRGHGPVDFSVHSRKNQDFTLGVTEFKKENFKQGVAQNIVQLEATLTSKKRKRETFDTEGEEGPACKMRSYGIITDSKEWFFLECTLDENEAVSYKMKRVPAYVDYDVKWRENEVSTTSIKTVFLHLVWLFTWMTDELPGRESQSSSLPTNKRRAINRVAVNDI